MNQEVEPSMPNEITIFSHTNMLGIALA